MNPSELKARLRVGQAVIREAGKLALSYQARRATLAIDNKGVQDLVSEADRACEELIVAALSDAFPGDALLGEEGGIRNAGGEAIWVIDPIDGTRNFLTGVPFWCISIALVAEGQSVLGLVYHPVVDELFSAARDDGAFANGVRLQVSGETEPTRARLGLGFNFSRPVADHVRTIENCLSQKVEYCRLGSGALALAYVAAGRLDGFWERRTNAWDIAAGLCLVREAGGWTSDFFAGEGLMSGKEVLAATPGLVADFQRLTGFSERT
jgi:myo-inositol-1(or 4)-monophosphatase